jgi:hypothetical protein
MKERVLYWVLGGGGGLGSKEKRFHVAFGPNGALYGIKCDPLVTESVGWLPNNTHLKPLVYHDVLLSIAEPFHSSPRGR